MTKLTTQFQDPNIKEWFTLDYIDNVPDHKVYYMHSVKYPEIQIAIMDRDITQWATRYKEELLIVPVK